MFMTHTVTVSKLGIDTPDPPAAIRGRCRCGHWACFHRADRFADIDPCRLCLCGYYEDGLEAAPPAPIFTPRVSMIDFIEAATA